MRAVIMDIYGNCIIQKFFEHGTGHQKRLLVGEMKGHVVSMSLHIYGCRVVQKALESVPMGCS